MIENVEQHLATCQQTFDDLLEASVDLANIIGPEWKSELRVLASPLRSLERRAHVLDAAASRFLKDVQ